MNVNHTFVVMSLLGSFNLLVTHRYQSVLIRQSTGGIICQRKVNGDSDIVYTSIIAYLDGQKKGRRK